ncbi:MAG: hypothetical protein LBC74_13835 [Planctomycetaceae bacterium]|nr:hypothetical protein [Planctomycetaceae bacterium]
MKDKRSNASVIGDDREEYQSNGEIWGKKYIEKPHGLLKYFLAWWTKKPLPERKTDWVVVGRWDK